uniref:Uncharacterized protein n=1 Tax=Anguilla anguilla TaxID=7936 RepID=A0A0E9VFF6_ANGAN
METVPPGRRP